MGAGLSAGPFVLRYQRGKEPTIELRETAILGRDRTTHRTVAVRSLNPRRVVRRRLTPAQYADAGPIPAEPSQAP